MTSRLVVLVPTTHGKPEPACEEGLRALERSGIEVRRVSGYAAIDFARCIMATRALDDGFDELLWIDDDIAFDPTDVERLRTSDQVLVAGAYAKKGRRQLAVRELPGTASFTFGPRGGLQEVLYAGTGFMYTRRALYDAMSTELPVCNTQFGQRVVPYFLPFVVQTEAGPWYLGEDYAFCERARRAGFKVFIDTRIRLHHIGPYHYGWEDAGRENERFATYVYHLR
ncbi:MAG: hypothetical protein QM778_17815 [Myxococcales bacterium]